jgi:hypothetical protein
MQAEVLFLKPMIIVSYHDYANHEKFKMDVDCVLRLEDVEVVSIVIGGKTPHQERSTKIAAGGDLVPIILIKL